MQLSPSVLILRRTYVKLIDILGDIGGLMATINMIFKVISSLSVNILYEKSLVNNLFNFDLDKKIIIFKNKKIKKNNIEYKSGDKNYFRIFKNPSNNGYDDTNIVDANINDVISLDKKVANEENLDIKRKKRKSDIKKDIYSSQSNISLYQKDNKSLILNFGINNDR